MQANDGKVTRRCLCSSPPVVSGTPDHGTGGNSDQLRGAKKYPVTVPCTGTGRKIATGVESLTSMMCWNFFSGFGAVFANGRQGALEIIGKWGFEFHSFSRDRMVESQL